MKANIYTIDRGLLTLGDQEHKGVIVIRVDTIEAFKYTPARSGLGLDPHFWSVDFTLTTNTIGAIFISDSDITDFTMQLFAAMEDAITALTPVYVLNPSKEES